MTCSRGLLMQECFKGEVVEEILRPHLSEIKGTWEEGAIFYVENDNLALFEEMSPRVYRGHYFFNSARGKEALRMAKDALNLIFQKAEVIQGWTPTNKKAALLMSRWLGFKSHGLIQTTNGPCELFILTKQEWSS